MLADFDGSAGPAAKAGEVGGRSPIAPGGNEGAAPRVRGVTGGAPDGSAGASRGADSTSSVSGGAIFGASLWPGWRGGSGAFGALDVTARGIGRGGCELVRGSPRAPSFPSLFAPEAP
jgi:hypothetical protein